MNKVILVMVDALNNEAASSAMGYMSHLVQNNIAAKFTLKANLPSSSRPMYESILTGTPCYVHGINNNNIVRRSHEVSLFQLAAENGLTTGAAAYYWISELYNKAPFNYIEDREQNSNYSYIQHGLFYFDDSYPDTHLFIDGEIIRKKYDPDFLLIHPMGVDFKGHLYGAGSREYRSKVIEIDNILGSILPVWMKEGYHIIITADHGMDSLGLHNGIEKGEREVPLWIISPNVEAKEYNMDISNLIIAPLVCKMLNIEKSKKMLNSNLVQLESDGVL